METDFKNKRREMNFLVELKPIKDDWELQISIIWDDRHLSMPVFIKNTAFMIHPNRPSGGTSDYGDWYLASKSKLKWQNFLADYLNE